MGKIFTIGYIKTLKLLVYILNYKVNKKDKLDDKNKKGILIDFYRFHFGSDCAMVVLYIVIIY